MFSSHRSPSRSEYLLRETLLKDELHREKERGRDRERERGEEEPYLPRRASLHRSFTENTLPIPRATSLSPTRRHHRHQHHPPSESPYDQILRARLDKVLISAQRQRDISHHGHLYPSASASSSSSSLGKRASLPATPHAVETSGGSGWIWREDETIEGSLGRGRGCESSWKNHTRHERNESTGLLTPGDGPSTSAQGGDARSSVKSRARSYTAPTSPPLSLSPHPTNTVRDPSHSPSSSSTHSLPKKSRAVPLETVYSGEDNVPVPGAGAGAGAGAGVVARGTERTEYKNTKGQGQDGMLTPPPTPPSPMFSRLSLSSSSKREEEEGVGTKSRLNVSRHHRRTMSEFPPSLPSQLQSQPQPRLISVRDPEDDDDVKASGSCESGSGSDSASPTSCRSLPLPLPLPLSSARSPTRPQRPQLPPRAHTQTNATGSSSARTKFNVRMASAQCKQLEGYVSFMAVEGLGEPGPEGEEDGGGGGGVEECAGKKGKRWLLF